MSQIRTSKRYDLMLSVPELLQWVPPSELLQQVGKSRSLISGHMAAPVRFAGAHLVGPHVDEARPISAPCSK